MTAGDWFDLSDPKSVYEGKPSPLTNQPTPSSPPMPLLTDCAEQQLQRAGPAPVWIEPRWVGRAIRLGWALVATLAARAIIDGARLVLAVAGVLG